MHSRRELWRRRSERRKKVRNLSSTALKQILKKGLASLSHIITTHHHFLELHLMKQRNRTLKIQQHKRSRSLSILEKKFRSAINILLEENLEFWMRFSTSMHQTHKFQDSIEDLKCEVRSIRDDNMSNENSNIMQSEIKAIIKHLREIRSELLLWLEHSEILHEELQRRHPSLCTLQDEIARAATPNSASNMAELSGFQAAKFQGEVLNMKQENNKVRNQP